MDDETSPPANSVRPPVRAAADPISHRLHALYDRVLREPVPEHMFDVLLRARKEHGLSTLARDRVSPVQAEDTTIDRQSPDGSGQVED